MVDRQRLLWAVATRRQLERWEAVLAPCVRGAMVDREPAGVDVWSAAIEHHFALVAARHLLRALELPPALGLSVDPTLSAELIGGAISTSTGLRTCPCST
jgi:hypothetical protein